MVGDVTQLLAALSEGHDSAADKLVPIIYDELRRMAHGLLLGERAGHTLQTTALVHEAYLKLANGRGAQWKDRAHFFAIAAQAMRRILVDHARTQKRDKRGGRWNRLPFDDQGGLTIEPGSDDVDLIALDDALSRLAQDQPQAGRVVEMRYFGGLSTDDIALALNVSGRTIEREWRYARAWLFDELGGNGQQ